MKLGARRLCTGGLAVLLVLVVAWAVIVAGGAPPGPLPLTFLHRTNAPGGRPCAVFVLTNTHSRPINYRACAQLKLDNVWGWRERSFEDAMMFGSSSTPGRSYVQLHIALPAAGVRWRAYTSYAVEPSRRQRACNSIRDYLTRKNLPFLARLFPRHVTYWHDFTGPEMDP